jgi:hypothetical protein
MQLMLDYKQTMSINEANRQIYTYEQCHACHITTTQAKVQQYICSFIDFLEHLVQSNDYRHDYKHVTKILAAILQPQEGPFDKFLSFACQTPS